jgi:alpha-galactosidase
LCERDIAENGLAIKIHSTLDRREAFRNAKYVVNSVRVGMLEGFTTDIEIPLRYGVDQCVGIPCAQRRYVRPKSAYEILQFCKDIEEVALPAASCSTIRIQTRL